MQCVITDWAHVLEPSSAPPEWRICWVLVGMPTPLPTEQWGDMLNAAEAIYGKDSVLKGLKLARDFPITDGWTSSEKKLAERLCGLE